jgi:hypothetical protein
MDMQAFLNALVPNIPQKLLRTIQQESALGVHSQSGNQAFLVLRVDSYEQAFSGMLEWENTLGSDLVPLFNTQSLQTGFIDKIIENHDARVLEDQSGTIVLLWTFLDRNTLVITTNNATLHEIISRVQNAPTTPQS